LNVLDDDEVLPELTQGGYWISTANCYYKAQAPVILDTCLCTGVDLEFDENSQSQSISLASCHTPFIFL
jgi:hypothetical protein